jgi:hypothetical protein
MVLLSTFVAALAPLSCAPGAGPEPSVLELRLRLPKVSEGVLLNEPVIAYFTDDLDRSTVTPDSVRILDPEGRRARGTLGVEGAELRFVPAPVYRADLSDGGFRPGTTYTVELRGFPDPGGLRAVDGAPLRSTVRWSFTTVSAGAGGGLAFQDATPERGSPLTPYTGIVEPEGPRSSLILGCAEPLDPSTLRGSDFAVRPKRGGAPVGVRAVLCEPPLDRLSGRLLAGYRSAGWVELIPLARLEPGEYWLEFEPALALRDYGGNPVWVTWPGQAEGAPFPQFSVSGASTRPPGRYRESFLDTVRRSPVVPPDEGRPWDGMAHWGRTGRVAIRYPAAVGDGSDGEVTFDAAVLDDRRTELDATRLSIPGELHLTAPGLVVLRAQGRMHVEGRLHRTPVLDPDRPPPSMKDSFDGGTLSDWLARARATDPPWLVLIAGGDLVIGDFDFDTPVLCAAGGVVRITGRGGELVPNELWVLGEGGATDPDTSVERANLVIDPPATNPLVERLGFAVMSGPLPPRGKVVRWLAGHVDGHAGTGRYRVRYLLDPVDLAPGVTPELVDDPRFLDDASPIRFLVELELGPGVAWDPPFVDEVVLTWEEERR